MRKTVSFFLFIVALSVSDMVSARDSEPVLPKTQMQAPKKVAPVKNVGGRDKVTGLTESAQNKIISQMATTLDSFASASLYISDALEIETKKSIDFVHKMKKEALNESLPFATRLATLSKMQAYTAYGLSYTVALQASSNMLKAGYEVDEIPITAIQNEIRYADLLAAQVVNPDSFSVEGLSELDFLSYRCMSFYFLCYNGSLPEEAEGYLSFDDKVRFVADFASSKVGDLTNSPKMQFRAMAILESPAFVWTYRPFIEKFCVQSSDALAYMHYITASDTFSRLLIDDAFKNVTDKEFEDGLLRITELKSRALLLIAKRIAEQFKQK